MDVAQLLYVGVSACESKIALALYIRSLSASRKHASLLIALAANQTSWELRHLCTEDSSLLQAVLASCCGSISLRFGTNGSSSHLQVCDLQTDITTAKVVPPNFLHEALSAVV
jgi:hypothetical protein